MAELESVSCLLIINTVSTHFVLFDNFHIDVIINRSHILLIRRHKMIRVLSKLKFTLLS